MQRWGIIALGILISAGLISAQPVACGDTLTGGAYTLAGDLDCCASGGFVTLQDGAHLNLGGFTVSGPIILDGTSAQLTNGAVQTCHDWLLVITLTGAGRHRVTRVSVYGSEGTGVFIESDKNRLTALEIGSDTGIWIEGDWNVISGSTFIQGIDAMTVIGKHNQLINNAISGVIRGVYVEGERNMLLGNRVSDGDGGIELADGSRRNVISHNTAFRAIDGNGDCEHNHWLANTFELVDPPCILEGSVAGVASAR